MTEHLSSLLLSNTTAPLRRPLKILDLCSGSGCISLLLYALLRSSYPLKVKGVDISPSAIDLARTNLSYTILSSQIPPTAREDITFGQADILDPSFLQTLLTEDTGRKAPEKWDILVSNPPYISPSGFAHSTARSVRNYEPRIALVPPSPSPAAGAPPTSVAPPPPVIDKTTTIQYPAKNERKDSTNISQEQEAEEDARIGLEFYSPLLRIAEAARTQIVLFELGDELQARRVLQLGLKAGWKAEVWRDQPAFENERIPSDRHKGSRAEEDLLMEDLAKKDIIEDGDRVGFEDETWIVNLGNRTDPNDSNDSKIEVEVEVKVKGRGKVRGLLFWRDQRGHWIGRQAQERLE